MKLTLRRRIVIMIILFSVISNIFCITLNYRNFVNSNLEFSFSTASTVAKTCVLVINNDKLQNYLTTLRRDSDYYVTWNKLIDYKNTNEDIVDLSVVSFREDGCHYIYDTDLSEDGAFLGDHRAFDSSQVGNKEKLMKGTDIGYITYSNHLEVYIPLHSSYDIPVGYVVVGISTEDAVREQWIYLVKNTVILSVVTIVLCIIILIMLSRTVIQPINRLSEAASNYEDSIDKETNTSALSRLQVNTGDEIETLSISMKKMEKDILNSAARLSVANWNSYHDSMTQLYNNRHLSESKDMYSRLKSIGAMFFDIDNLKKMNDTCGHEAGDEIIKKTAEFILKYSREIAESWAYRLGGDEFLLIIGNCTQEYLNDLQLQMKSDPKSNLSAPDQPVKCRIAIGCGYLEGEIDIDYLVKLADQDMYRDKRTHR